jgi:hypothetical protein
MINKIAKKIKPANADTKADMYLKVLLEGKIINRKNLSKHGLGEHNDSAHSVISLLRNKRFIPIDSKRNELTGNICSYSMDPVEIKRYYDPEQRRLQIEEMKIIISEKEAQKTQKSIFKYIRSLEGKRHIEQYSDNTSPRLNDILKELMRYTQVN